MKVRILASWIGNIVILFFVAIFLFMLTASDLLVHCNMFILSTGIVVMVVKHFLLHLIYRALKQELDDSEHT